MMATLLAILFIFLNDEISAAITRIDGDVIHRCGITFKTLSCGFQINTNAFEKYTLETAKL